LGKTTELRTPGHDPRVSGAAREANPSITYTIQLRSALPIRQALVRLQQIERKYAKMSAEERQKFDQTASGFLTASFPDSVVVHVEYGANAPLFERSLAQYWQTSNREELKRSMYVFVPGKEKIPALKLIMGRGDSRGFEMVFPRTVNGKPLLDSAAKTLAIEFDAPQMEDAPVPGGLASGIRIRRILVEFKVAKMLVSGKLED